jgi:CheY-like chemotaxis protein
VRQGGFDLLLLDLSMPGRSGVDLIRQIKARRPSWPS